MLPRPSFNPSPGAAGDNIGRLNATEPIPVVVVVRGDDESSSSGGLPRESSIDNSSTTSTSNGSMVALNVVSMNPVASSAPILITVPPTAGPMSVEEQRHRLMQDMVTMQSRLLGEQRVLQEVMQDSVLKEDSYTTMAAAVAEQEESLRLEKQMLADLKRSDAASMHFDTEVLRHDVRALKDQVAGFEQLEAENADLERQIQVARTNRGDLLLAHAAKQSDLNAQMLAFRYRLEELFRKSVLEHSKRCKRVSFDAFLDSDKSQLLQNQLLGEELSLQRVGMENLRYRFDQLGEECQRVRSEIVDFQRNSTAYARKIAELRHVQSRIDAKAHDISARYADVLKEHEELRRGANLPARIARLKDEICSYERSCQRAEASCLKWKKRLHKATHGRHLLKQHVIEAHSSTNAALSPSKTSSISRSRQLNTSPCGCRPHTPLNPQLLEYVIQQHHHYQQQQQQRVPGPLSPTPAAGSEPDVPASQPSPPPPMLTKDICMLPPPSLSTSSSSSLSSTGQGAPAPSQLYQSLKSQLHHWTKEGQRSPRYHKQHHHPPPLKGKEEDVEAWLSLKDRRDSALSSLSQSTQDQEDDDRANRPSLQEVLDAQRELLRKRDRAFSACSPLPKSVPLSPHCWPSGHTTTMASSPRVMLRLDPVGGDVVIPGSRPSTAPGMTTTVSPAVNTSTTTRRATSKEHCRMTRFSVGLTSMDGATFESTSLDTRRRARPIDTWVSMSATRPNTSPLLPTTTRSPLTATTASNHHYNKTLAGTKMVSAKQQQQQLSSTEAQSVRSRVSMAASVPTTAKGVAIAVTTSTTGPDSDLPPAHPDKAKATPSEAPAGRRRGVVSKRQNPRLDEQQKQKQSLAAVVVPARRRGTLQQVLLANAAALHHQPMARRIAAAARLC